MKNFSLRLVTGLSLAIIIVWGVLWSQWFYFFLTLIVATGTMWEFCSLVEKNRSIDGKFAMTYKKLLTATVVVLMSLSFFLNFRYLLADIAYFFPVVLFGYFTLELYAKSEKPFENIAWNVLALCYILLPFLLLHKLYFDKGKLVVLAVIFLSWFYDSFCYVFGSLFGKHKLFERVSPKKSIEGLIGGSIALLVFAYFYPIILSKIAAAIPTYSLYSLSYSSSQWIFLGLMSVVGGTYGDLIESLFKRSIGVKDSGSFLPGHGGFLDRLDAILMGIPFLALGFWIVDQWTSIVLIMKFLK